MASCEPNWHSGIPVPAAFMVATTRRLDANPIAPVTLELLNSSWTQGVRFACCDRHLGRAVEIMAARTRFVAVWKLTE